MGQYDTKAVGDFYGYIYQEFNVGFEFDLTIFHILIKKVIKVRRLSPFEYVTLTDKDEKDVTTSNNLLAKYGSRRLHSDSSTNAQQKDKRKFFIGGLYRFV